MSVVRDQDVGRVELGCFFAATLTVSTLAVFLSGDYVDAGAGAEAAGAWFGEKALIIIWMPMLCAVLTAGLFRGRAAVLRLVGRLSPRAIALRWWFAAPLIPVAVNLVAILATGSVREGTPVQLLWVWLSVFPFLALIMIGEEMGWRGYALPGLQAHHSPFIATLLLGAAWGLWHYPVWFGLFLGITGDPWIAALLTLVNTINTLGLAFVFTWVANRTGANVLAAMVFHGANNATLRLYAETADFLAYAIAYGLTLAVAVVLVVRNRQEFLVRPVT